MSDTDKGDPSTSALLLERMAVPELQNVYSLGSLASRLTFYSQQHRAFNLIWSLTEEKRLRAGDQLGIVGAGLAGITAAVAAHQIGCKVSVFEKSYNLMHLQRVNKSRYVHPNLYDWPDPKAGSEISSEFPQTRLPYLNWSANTTEKVVRQLDRQWEQLSDGIEVHFGYEVNSIRVFESRPLLIAYRQKFNQEKPAVIQRNFDCIILAVGFGLEKQLEPLKFHSYWETDGLEQPVTVVPFTYKHWLVTGCGDGGLIDTLRLRLDNFQHAELVKDLYSGVEFFPLKGRLRKIEDEALGRLRRGDNEDEIGIFIYQQYDGLDIPRPLIQRLKARLRQNTHVTLNSPSPSPMSLRASILNRFSVFLLLKYGDLNYHAGKVVKARQLENSYEVTFERGGGVRHFDTLQFHDIVVRFGAEPAIDRLLSLKALEDLKSKAAVKLYEADITRQRLWPDGFFPVVEVEAPNDSLEHAVEHAGEASVLLMKLPGAQAFAIQRHKDGTVGYVVTIGPSAGAGAEERPETFAGLPVDYIESPDEVQAQQSALETVDDEEDDGYRSSPTRGAGRGQRPEGRPPLVCGAALATYDFDPRGRAPASLTGGGTLGSFVRLRNDRVGILSSNSALAQVNKAMVGAQIYLRAGAGGLPGRPVAALHSFVPLEFSPAGATPLSGRLVFNQVDAAVAELLPEVEYALGLRGAPQLVGAGAARLGDRVFKVGSGGAVTWGEVTGVSTVVGPIDYGEGLCWFKNSIEITGASGEAFSGPGDSGALVVREEGTAVGLIYAGNGTQSFACPLETILATLGCSLLLY